MKKLIIAIVTINITQTSWAFYIDVPIESFLYPSIKYLTEKQFIKGYPDNTFGITKPINRAEALKIILSATETSINTEVKENPFPDVAKDAWFAPFVKHAKEKKIISGNTETGNFSPEKQVNRAEFLKMILQAFEVKTSDFKITTKIKDVPADAWFAPYINFSAQFNILPLDEGNAHPAKLLTRGEAAYLLYKTLEMGRGLTPQTILNLMDRHMAFALQSIAGQNLKTAAFAASTAQIYGKNLSYLNKNQTIKAAKNMADSIVSLVGAYVSIQNQDLNTTISAAKNTWALADEANKANTQQVTELVSEIKKLAEGLAKTARELQAK